MGSTPTGAVVLDAGALIAIERGSRQVLALCAEARRVGQSVVVPAGAVAQVWRDGRRQASLARVLGARGTIVEPLDFAEARSAGVLCGRTGTSDVVDASVVLAALRHGAPVLSSDRGDLQRIANDVRIIDC